MACVLTRTKKIIEQECGVRSEEVKLNSANPPSPTPRSSLWDGPRQESSSMASLVPWPLPSSSHFFLHFFVPPHPPFAPSPLLLWPSPPAQPRRGCSSRTARAGVAGRDAREPPCLPAPCDAGVLFRLSRKLAAVLELASRWSLWDGKAAMLCW